MRKAYLEKTAEDETARGGTPSKRLLDNPGKCLADLMDNNEIENH